MKRFILALGLVLFVPGSSFAFGEVFKVETSGTEYCGDFQAGKFNANNNVDLWVEIVSEIEIMVSFTPDFQAGTYFSMFGETYLRNSKSAVFVGGQLFSPGDNLGARLAYVTIQGTASFDKFGNTTRLTGTFIESEVLRDGCFSSGTFKTTQKLN